MRTQITNQDYEKISAYLDGQLSARERQRFESVLQTRPDLKNEVDDLRRMKASFGSLPKKKAPRSFMLTPAMVGQTGSNRSGQSLSSRLFPGFSLASALAAVVLLVTFIIELVPGTSMSQPALMKEAGAPMQLAAQPAATIAPLTREAEQPVPEAPAAESFAMPETPMDGQSQPAEPPIEKAMPEAAMDAAPAGAPENVVGLGGPEGEIGPIYGPGAPIGEYATAPNSSAGMGGGGAPDQYSYGSDMPGGPFTLPLEAIESIPEANMERSVSPGTQAPEASLPYQGPSTGPILGVAPQEQAGEIENRSGWGLPLNADQTATAAEASVEPQRTVFGLPVYRSLQAMLLLLAILTGGAAIFFRARDQHGRR